MLESLEFTKQLHQEIQEIETSKIASKMIIYIYREREREIDIEARRQ